MARTRKTAAVDSDSSVDSSDGLENETDTKIDSKVTTVLVRGKSALPATAPDNKRYGHWSGGDSTRNGEGAIHWPGDAMVEHRVTIPVLDRLKADPNLSLSFDPAEEAAARANVAPEMQAQDLALQAAEAELRAQELKAQAAAAAAQALAAEAAASAEQTRRKVAALREQKQ